MIRRHAPLVSKKDVNLRPIYLFPICLAGQQLVSAFWSRTAGEPNTEAAASVNRRLPQLDETLGGATRHGFCIIEDLNSRSGFRSRHLYSQLLSLKALRATP